MMMNETERLAALASAKAALAAAARDARRVTPAFAIAVTPPADVGFDGADEEEAALRIPAIKFEAAAEDDKAAPPPIDCRAPWSPQGVIISDTTAILFAELFSMAAGRGALSATSRRGAENLQRAFDEVSLIIRDVATPARDRPATEI